MVNSLRKTASGKRAREADVPEEIARSLDASADDLRHDRTEDVGEFLERAKQKLADHRASKGPSPKGS